MKINCIQRILLFILLCVFLSISENGFTYSASKHHRHMGVRAADESSLDRYLKDNLGFSRGINTTLTNPDEPEGEQTKKIYEWIGYGAVKEDDLFPIVRVVYHFYDPVSNLGLSDYAPFLDSSLVWGNDAPLNDYSWSDTREYYYLALTSRTKEEREKYWALTFRALGQVLHLVQDIASPAHVRNDNHPSGVDDDPYESTWGTSPEGISFIHAILAHGALGNTDYQYPAVELDRFDDYWDTGDGQGLAEFTNSNFVSKDTNVDVLTGPHHYDNPQPIGLHNEPFEFTDSNNVRRTVNVTYYTSNVVDNYAPERSVSSFNYLTAASYWNFYTMRYDSTRIHYTLNRKCHEEYAKLLVPRTVGYGAGLLNYFFRGTLDIDDFFLDPLDTTKLVLRIKNITGLHTSHLNDDENLTGGDISVYKNDLSIYDSDSRLYVYYEYIRTSEVNNVDIYNNDVYDLTLDFRPRESTSPENRHMHILYHGGSLGNENCNNNQLLSCYTLFWDKVSERLGWKYKNGVYDGPLITRWASPHVDSGHPEPQDKYAGRGEIRLTISNFERGSIIKKAKLFLNVGAGDEISIHEVTMYDRMYPEFDPIPIAIIPANNVFSHYEIDITQKYQNWIDNGFNQITFLVKFTNEENIPNQRRNVDIDYLSERGDYPFIFPRVIVTYDRD